jgi:hypothetical protein
MPKRLLHGSLYPILEGCPLFGGGGGSRTLVAPLLSIGASCPSGASLPACRQAGVSLSPRSVTEVSDSLRGKSFSPQSPLSGSIEISGGGGSRTRVPKQSDKSRYMLSLSFKLNPEKLRHTGFSQDAAFFVSPCTSRQRYRISL